MKIRNLEWPARGLLYMVISASALSAAVVPVVRLNPASPQFRRSVMGPPWRPTELRPTTWPSTQAAHILQRLEKSATIYRVEILDSSISGSVVMANEFDGVQNLSRWDPGTGLSWAGGGKFRRAHSAAIGLMHELAHAYHKEVSPARFFRFSNSPTCDQWKNVEEKRTILHIENPIARALGESERQFHDDDGSFSCERFATTSPTSTVRATTRAVFKPMPKRDPSVEQKLAEFLRRCGGTLTSSGA